MKEEMDELYKKIGKQDIELEFLIIKLVYHSFCKFT